MQRWLIGSVPVNGDLLFKLVADHGPWVLLVFFLLWRDAEKDRATRAILEKKRSHPDRDRHGHQGTTAKELNR